MMEAEIESPHLPNGWFLSELEDLVINPKNDVVDGPFGSNLKASEYEIDGVPIIRLQNIDRNNFINKNIRFISHQKAAQLIRHSFSKNDIIITKLGNPLGKACLVPENIDWGIIVADVVRIKLNEKYVNKKYLVYSINSDSIIKQFKTKTKGTTRPRVNLIHIRKLKIPIAPLPEQHRIVARIEELFSRLDAGVEALRKAKAQLRRYRQSVLKAAVEGRLTEEWRKSHKPDLSAEAILFREISDDPNLPDSWVWTKYDQIGKWFGGGTPSKQILTYWSNGTIPWISPKDMKSEKIYDSQDKITFEAIKNSSAKLIPAGSLLFVVRSGIIQRMLPVASLKVEAAVNQDLKALTPDKRVDEDYLLYSTLALSESIRNKCAKDGTTVQSIEFKSLKDFPIPLPPLEEQRQIVKIIERIRSLLFEIEIAIDATQKNKDRLRQSILKHAFEGKLVPQNPSDEPASVLLERIKAERIEDSPRRGRKSNNFRQMRLIQ